ncbi:hypothetical protein [Streptomyces gobiensis]|uniref:hypothetical protein n=1 Tax=Streptomyces gobiensis TaxID=2875706 RepID=UPI001E4B85E1|nr:hypothetical protein [Streptomyces gobiensis]UGY93943.1 hypothetical protein test1122_20970 [Streptomyces gobiensis]
MPESQPEGKRQRIPANAEEALQAARTQFAPIWPDGTPAPLNVLEFDVGYLVYASFPHPPASPSDRRRPMGNPGGTCVVVSKEDGEIRTLPHRPPQAAIALYRKMYRPSAE